MAQHKENCTVLLRNGWCCFFSVSLPFQKQYTLYIVWSWLFFLAWIGSFAISLLGRRNSLTFIKLNGKNAISFDWFQPLNHVFRGHWFGTCCSLFLLFKQTNARKTFPFMIHYGLCHITTKTTIGEWNQQKKTENNKHWRTILKCFFEITITRKHWDWRVKLQIQSNLNYINGLCVIQCKFSVMIAKNIQNKFELTLKRIVTLQTEYQITETDSFFCAQCHLNRRRTFISSESLFDLSIGAKRQTINT